MGRVNTDDVSLSFTRQAGLGSLGGSPQWFQLEVNNPDQVVDNFERAFRNPISRQRARRSSKIIRRPSPTNLTMDFVLDHIIRFTDMFMYSTYQGASIFRPTAVTSGGSGGYTVASGGALAANTLVFARGFTNATNNGLKVVASGSTGTNIRVDGLVAEASPPSNAIVEVAGFRTATGDLDVDASQNLTTTVLDFTTLPFVANQVIHIGGEASINQFTDSANAGFARIETISANELTLSKRKGTFNTEANTTQAVDLLYGRFARDVPVTDADFLEVFGRFEVTYPNLQNPSGDEFVYANDRIANAMTINLPLSALGTMNMTFVGTSTDDPVTTQQTNASAALAPTQTESFSTGNDVARRRITETDETVITSDVTQWNITVNNNASGQFVHSSSNTAAFLNRGNQEIDVTTTLVYTDSTLLDAISSDREVTAEYAMRQADGGVFYDFAACKLGNGGQDFPRNEAVLINVDLGVFLGTAKPYQLGVSIFPFLPPIPTGGM